MASIRQKDLSALKEAQSKLDKFLAAACGEESTCSTFEHRPGSPCEPFSAAQRDQVRLYLESWVAPALAAAIEGIEGVRDFSNETYLDGIHTGHWGTC